MKNKKEVNMKSFESPHIDVAKKTIEFFIQNDCAHQISLSGTFNNWAQDVLLMESDDEGVWKIEIPLLPKGNYKYKFFIDDKMWVEDYDNPVREPDGINGWNSILLIQ
jgi:1,4-alpha-glucan branching enzyme